MIEFLEKKIVKPDRKIIPTKPEIPEWTEPEHLKDEIKLPPLSYEKTDDPKKWIATRKAYGLALKNLGSVDLAKKVVVLDGDTKNSTHAEEFFKKYPENFIECFIAEQNMVSVACGLAARKKIPFSSTFGAFFSRAFDQIRMAGVSRTNMILAGSHCGVSIGEDGISPKKFYLSILISHNLFTLNINLIFISIIQSLGPS